MMRRRQFFSLAPVLLMSRTAHATAAPAPRIIAAADWGGIPSEGPQPTQEIRHITLHHEGETWVVGNDPAAYLRRLQKWSRETKHWPDIPYHYVIAPDGRTYAARPETQPGDTNTEYDPRGHALVMLLGNFEEVEPTPEALGACAELMAWIAVRHGLSADSIASHKDYSTQTVCPGAHLYRYLQNGWLKRAVAERISSRPLPALA